MYHGWCRQQVRPRWRSASKLQHEGDISLVVLCAAAERMLMDEATLSSLPEQNRVRVASGIGEGPMFVSPQRLS
jgi:hypothetical protein